MCKAWKRGGDLTLDEEQMEFMANGELDTLKTALDTLERRGRITVERDDSEEGALYHITIPRLVVVYEEQMEKHERAVEHGRAGAKRRYSKDPEVPEFAPVTIQADPSIAEIVPKTRSERIAEEKILSKHQNPEANAVVEEIRESEPIKPADKAHVKIVKASLDALKETGKPMGLAMNPKLKERWARTLYEVFEDASRQMECTVDDVSKAFILRLRDADVRTRLQRTTWIRPEYLKTDWPAYVGYDIVREVQPKKSTTQRMVEQFYNGIALVERDLGAIEPERRASIISNFWTKLSKDHRLSEDQMKEMGYEPPTTDAPGIPRDV